MLDTTWKLVPVVSLGIFLRYSFRFSTYFTEISKRVEVSSPVSAWIRVVEGVTLKRLNIEPYNGDTFHESPLFFKFYQLLLNHLSEFYIAVLFIIIDIATAFILSKVANKQMIKMENSEQTLMEQHRKTIQVKRKEKEEKILNNLMIKSDAAEEVAEWIIWIYLLSPYSILPCVAQSTSVLNNFIISLILFQANNGQRYLSLALLALSSLNTFYSLILLPSVILILEKEFYHKSNKINSDKSPDKCSIVYSLFIFILFLISSLILCLWIENGSSRFFYSTYFFMWNVSDLTPNIGIFWYFFAEIFDHFRSFFLCVFQINYFIYIIPLTLKLWKNPYFLFLISLMNHSIFKPYPTVSDFILYISLLPQWGHLFQYLKSTLIVSGTIVTTTVLAPILWYLWIVLGTANANFYFGITLAFNVSQIFLVSDLIFAFIKREFYLNNFQIYKYCKLTEKQPTIQLSYN